MAIHPDFPSSPHVVLNPDVGWFPADEADVPLKMKRLKLWFEDI